jgi:hypothetical protein
MFTLDKNRCSQLAKIRNRTRDWEPSKTINYYDEPLLSVLSDSFPAIMTQWFLKNETRIISRYSFYKSYFQDTYTPERVVSTANMFDTMPDNCYAPSTDLDEKVSSLLLELKARIKKDFSDYSDVKNGLCQSIGYLKGKTLKSKIIEKAMMISNILDEGALPELDLVIKHGVNCRNFFVHGTQDKKIHPEEYINLLSFFTDTFEFIFICSELIEAGWGIKNNLSRRHKIASYIKDYTYNLKKLKKEITTSLLLNLEV